MKSLFKHIAEKAEVGFLEERRKRKSIQEAVEKAVRRAVAEYRENPRVNRKYMREDVRWHLHSKVRGRSALQQELPLPDSPQTAVRSTKPHPQRKWEDPK